MTEELINLKKKFAELVNRPRTDEETSELFKISELMKLEWNKLEINLSTELKEKEIFVDSSWDLVHTKKPYPEAIDTLIKHLGFDYHDTIKEGIIRSLIVKEARGKAASALIKEYEKIPKEKDDFRWITGCAIGATMTKDNIDWLISALLDKSNGGSRSGMIIPLVNIKSKKAEEVLLQLLVEENPGFGVILQAIEGLGKLKSQLAREKISTFLNHQNKDYKNAAKKALLRIDKN